MRFLPFVAKYRNDSQIALRLADEILRSYALHAAKAALCAGKPPKAAVGSLQNLVSDLRKALGRELVRTREPGYVLDIEPEQVDLHRFERLVAQASEGGDAELRSELLREALTLWRGPPL